MVPCQCCTSIDQLANNHCLPLLSSNSIYFDIHKKSKQFLIKWNLNICKGELEMNTSLQIYKEKCEESYCNMPSSTILNKVISNTLQLNDRNRQRNEEIYCLICDTDGKYIYTISCCIVQHTNKRDVNVYIHLQQPLYRK